jgi:long-chain acyl-CoA synthetase
MPKPGEVFTESVLREFLKGRLAGFKIPKIIIQHPEKLPRVASGKISKRQLKEEFLAQAVN